MTAISISLPNVGGDLDAWGEELNTALETLETGVNNALALLANLTNVPNVNLQNRGSSSYTGQQLSSTISDFAEAVQDAMGITLIAGPGISIGYDDVHNTVTISQSGAKSSVDIVWDGTGTPPTRASSGADPTQHVDWASPIGNPIPAGDPYALEQDGWDAE